MQGENLLVKLLEKTSGLKQKDIKMSSCFIKISTHNSIFY